MRLSTSLSTMHASRLLTSALLLVAVATMSNCAAKESPNDPNVTQPKAVTDLAVTATTDSGATLSFTEVDDGMGNAASYDIRVSTSKMSWSSATRVSKGTCATPLLGN